MKIVSNMLTKLTSLLLTSVLFFVHLSVKPCSMDSNLDQEADISQNSCCCCANSFNSLPTDDAAQHHCPCQMTQRQPAEHSTAVIVSQLDSKAETFLVTSKVEVISEDLLFLLTCLHHHSFSLSSRDRPLYLLHSTLLI